MNFISKIKKLWHAYEAPLTFIALNIIVAYFLMFLEDGWFIFNNEELTMLLTYLILFVYFYPKYKKERKNSEKKVKIKFNSFFRYIILGLSIAFVLNIFLYYLFVQILNMDATATTDGAETTVIYYVILCLLGPIIEELCCRAFVKIRLEKDFSNKFILISSSIAFGFMHSSSFVAIFYALIFGLFFMSIYMKKGNLLYPIICHIGANVGSAMFDFLPVPSFNNLYLYLPLFVFFSCLALYVLKKEKMLK